LIILLGWRGQRVAPIVASDPPDGIVIDSTGADHLHGGEHAMLDALIGRLTMSGVTARAAVADSWPRLMRWRALPPIPSLSRRRVTVPLCSIGFRSRRFGCRMQWSPISAFLASSVFAISWPAARAADASVRSRTRPPHQPGAR
jgi:hypothetical protein